MDAVALNEHLSTKLGSNNDVLPWGLNHTVITVEWICMTASVWHKVRLPGSVFEAEWRTVAGNPIAEILQLLLLCFIVHPVDNGGGVSFNESRSGTFVCLSSQSRWNLMSVWGLVLLSLRCSTSYPLPLSPILIHPQSAPPHIFTPSLSPLPFREHLSHLSDFSKPEVCHPAKPVIFHFSRKRLMAERMSRAQPHFLCWASYSPFSFPPHPAEG